MTLDGEVVKLVKRWAPALIKVAAVVWMAWSLAGLAWLAGGHDGARLPPAQPVSTQVVAAGNGVDTGKLASLSLFGHPAQTASSGGAGPDISNAPETTLQLKLNGVFVSQDSDASSAIVSDATNPANGKLYHVKESLPGGATLGGVYADSILIRRSDGPSEVLHFEKASTGQSLAGAAPFGMPGGDGPNVRSMIDQASAAMAQSPDAYLLSMGLLRQGNGFVLGPNAPDNILKASGLRPGDRFVSINGQPLTDPESVRQMLLQVKNQGSARVEIQRGNQTLTINQKF